MNISSETVKELRERTGAGMMDCKKALVSTNGDVEKALDWLRKQGLIKAAAKSARVAAEGLVGEAVKGDITAFVEVNCETDFVCKTDDFKNFVRKVSKYVIENKPKDVLAVQEKFKDEVTALVAKIGENIGIRRFALMSSSKTGRYIHAGSKIGVMASFDDPANKLTDEAAKDVAMHIAAMNPQYVRKGDVPENVIEREKGIYREQMAKEKKPAEVIEKIILGKLNKYLSEICVEDQIFVKDPLGKQTVAMMLKAIDPSIKIKEFVRYQVGEGVEKKKE